MFDFDDLVPVLIVGSVMFAIVSVTRILSENRTRRKLLEARVSDEAIRAMYAPGRDAIGGPVPLGSLKWGLVTVSLGMASLVVDALPDSASEPLIFGVVLLFAGSGLLTFYIIAALSARRSRMGSPSRPRADATLPAGPVRSQTQLEG